MNDLEWVIDTWVLYQVDSQDSVKAATACRFLATIFLRGQHKVAIDMNTESKIQREYERCFSKVKNDFPRKWWKYIKDFKLTFHSGKLAGRHVDYLTNRLGFDKGDLPFVGVASKTRSKLLVSEDSDYTPQMQEYLKNNLQVRVMSVDEADSCAS